MNMILMYITLLKENYQQETNCVMFVRMIQTYSCTSSFSSLRGLKLSEYMADQSMYMQSKMSFKEGALK